MAATFVTVAELRSNLGIGTLYDDSVVEAVCQTAQDLITKQLWYNSYPIVGAGIYSNNAYITIATSGSYVSGQTVKISNCKAPYNGTHTIAGTYPWTPGSASFPYFTWFPFNGMNYPRGYSLIQFPVTHADENYHLIVPYGRVEESVDSLEVEYADTPAIREAAMQIAVDVWQARQANNAGGISPDFTPSPYRMGSSLMARVRGLLAPYLNPRGMVG